MTAWLAGTMAFQPAVIEGRKWKGFRRKSIVRPSPGDSFLTTTHSTIAWKYVRQHHLESRSKNIPPGKKKKQGNPYNPQQHFFSLWITFVSMIFTKSSRVTRFLYNLREARESFSVNALVSSRACSVDRQNSRTSGHAIAPLPFVSCRRPFQFVPFNGRRRLLPPRWESHGR